MTYMKITFSSIAPIEDEDECVNLLSEYLGCLFKNGQILREYELIKFKESFCTFVTIPDDDALELKYNNVYINDYYNKGKSIFNISYEPIGENLYCGKPCKCSSPSWYMLYTDFITEESPVVCGDCGKEVPLYKLPYISNEKEHNAITSWQEIYKSIEKVWMYCLSDRFTFRQLSDPNSQLSKEGREICRELETKLGKPVYYYIFHSDKPLKECPSCGKPWTDSDNKKTVDFKCEACRLMTDK